MISIPGYKIDNTIGSGGMAEVYLGHQISIDRPVAIKVMSPTLSVDESFAKRFIKEANVGSLTHPNIITVYDAGVIDNHHYIIMEYVCGGDLAHKLADQILTFEQKIEIIKLIASALSYSFSKGFVHRDVKPENILFREDGTPVLADFGIAKAVSSATNLTSVGTAIGSPFYMSPEQTRGQEVDHRSDLYSLGVVFYEMLCGYRPFESGDTFAIGIKHINEAVPPLPSQLSKFQPLIDKILAKDPGQRFQNSQEFIVALENILVSEAGTVIQPAIDISSRPNVSSSASDPSIGENIHKVKEKSKFPYLIACCLLVFFVVGAGAVYTLLQTSQEQPVDTSSGKLPADSGDAVNQDADSNRNEQINIVGIDSKAKIPTVFSPSPDSRTEGPEKENSENTAMENSEKDALQTSIKSQVASVEPNNNETTAIEDIKEIESKRAEELRLLEQKRAEEKAKQDRLKKEREIATRLQQRREKIQSLLERANNLLLEEKYLMPKNQNAYYYFDQVLQIDKQNKAAKKGIRQIGTQIDQDMLLALKSNRFTVVESKSRLLLDYPHFVHIADKYFSKLKDARDKQLPLKQNEFQDALIAGGKGPIMVKIPAGSFLMGDIRGTDTEGDEKPVHEVTISNGFAIGKYEITFNQYQLFASSTGKPVPSDSGFGKGNRPVLNVSWSDAQEYVKWLSSQTGNQYRLPTESEWEYVARANTNSDYFWGDSVGRKNANCYGCSGGFDNKKTAEVGNYQPNGFGVYDMHGNLWEWVQDCWHDRYDGAPEDGSAWDSVQCNARVLRGGSWKNYPLFIRSANRDWYEPAKSSNQFGFRVVMEY